MIGWSSYLVIGPPELNKKYTHIFPKTWAIQWYNHPAAQSNTRLFTFSLTHPARNPTQLRWKTHSYIGSETKRKTNKATTSGRCKNVMSYLCDMNEHCIESPAIHLKDNLCVWRRWSLRHYVGDLTPPHEQ